MPTILNRSSMDEDTFGLLCALLSSVSRIEQVVRGGGTELQGLAFTRRIDHPDGSRDDLATRHADAYVLSFRTGRDGKLRAVTVWDHQPGAEELRAALAQPLLKPTASPQ